MIKIIVTIESNLVTLGNCSAEVLPPLCHSEPACRQAK